ncbi:MAG TPA: hypothetical protein VN660_06575 [Steroidobacteraceae bacterium]|nr:hypothetical protein [Steroidobacteraceae bacterium]
MLDWLLKYPGSDFARGKLTFLGVWPSLGREGMLLVLAAVLLVGLALIFISVARQRALPPGRRALLATLQALMLGMVLLELTQPALRLSTLAPGQNSIALLLDDSASMTLSDGHATRLAQAHALLQSPALADLGRRYRVRDFVFAGEAQPVDGYGLLPTPGDRTAIGAAVLHVLQAMHTSALGAVILLSDGDDSAGALSSQQLAQIASYGVPVHTIGLGRVRMPEDLELSQVTLPAHVLPGTSVVARASVLHDGPGNTRLKVYDGDRFLGSRDVALGDGDGEQSVPISFTLDQPGERVLTFSLEPKSEERELRNNTQVHTLQVRAERASVLYVEGEPRWEYKFMRRALEQDAGVRLVSLLRTSTNGYYRQGVDSPQELRDGFPTDAATLDAYDALIIGSLPAAWFRPEQLQMIHDFVSERGGSLMLLAGPEGLGNGGWGQGVIGQMLPVHLPASPAAGGPDSFHRERVAVALSAAGAQSPMLQLGGAGGGAEQGADEPSNQRLWNSLPPVQDYQDVGSPRLAATTWLNARVGQSLQPLLVSEPYGRGQTFVLATGGTWRWRMGLPSTDERHQQFWRQLVHALVAGVPQPFELTARTTGDGVQVRAQLRDAAFRPVDGATITVSVSSPHESFSFTLPPVTGQPGIYQTSWQPAAAGPIVFEASARRNAQSLGSARASLAYARGDAEFRSIRQNRALLRQLADSTGGRYWEAADLAGLPQAIGASNAGVLTQQLLPLWDAPLLFLLLAALKCSEWLLRRRWGII